MRVIKQVGKVHGGLEQIHGVVDYGFYDVLSGE